MNGGLDKEEDMMSGAVSARCLLIDASLNQVSQATLMLASPYWSSFYKPDFKEIPFISLGKKIFLSA